MEKASFIDFFWVWTPPGTIQRLLLENVEKARGVRIEYGKVALNVTEHEADDHPLHVTVQQVGRSQLNGGVGVNSGNEIIRTKFLVGCDGAHSWTRKFFEIPMIGQRVDSVWGEFSIIIQLASVHGHSLEYRGNGHSPKDELPRHTEELHD